MQVSDEVKAVLEAIYKAADMHSDLDWEITLAGNGTNAGEALQAYRALFADLGLDEPQYTPQERDELIRSMGEDPEDY